VSGLPTVKYIHIIGELPQPFDEMDFFWLHLLWRAFFDVVALKPPEVAAKAAVYGGL
jgi:hypothetical protein